MFIFKALFVFLIIYLICYFIYFVYITYCSKLGKVKEIKNRNYEAKYNLTLSVIVYSHNNADNVASLVEALKKQSYDYDSYEINVILDNCADNSAKKLEIIGGARLWRINNENNEPVGKNKAVSWLLERIIKQENTNAFVLLNADCIVKPDLLTKINNEIGEVPVLTGRIIHNPSFNNFAAGFIAYRSKITDLLLKRGRSFAGLNNIINTDLCVIRQDVLEKVFFQPISNNNAEVDYSIELNKNNIPIKYSSQVAAFKKSNETLNTYLKKVNINTFAKINGFKANFKVLFSKEMSLKQKEFIVSLIYPSETITAASLLLVLIITNNLYPVFSLKLNKIILACFIFMTALSLMIVKLNVKDMFFGLLWMFSSPFMLGYNFIKNTNKKLLLKNTFNKKKEVIFKTENPNVKAVLTDGKNEYLCNIEYVSEDALYTIVFWFKNKKLSSSKHLRYSDALKEIIDKLYEHGYALKVCQNCGYFKLSNNGRSNCDKGKCMQGIINDIEETPRITHIWDSCSHIIPIHAQKYVMNQIKNKNI